MEGAVVQNQPQQQQQQQQPQQPQVERLNQAVQQQLNLEAVKTRAISLFKAISRIIDDFDAYGRTNTTPKWYSFSLSLSHTSLILVLCFVTEIAEVLTISQFRLLIFVHCRFSRVCFFCFKINFTIQSL
jgi:hypothetical protein